MVFLLPFTCISQAKIDCEKYFMKAEVDDAIYDSFEDPPIPINGYKIFYMNIRNKTSESVKKGKVFIQFVVDTLGDVHCARVVKSEVKELDSKAIAFIEKERFKPARQEGKKIISTIILPIPFGAGPTEKRKKCKR